MPGSMNMPPMGGASLSHLVPYGGAAPHGAAQGTPEQHFANHLQDHYGMQVANYNQPALSHHAHNFAQQHGCHDQSGMAQLQHMVMSLMNELALLKQHGPGSSPHTGPHKGESLGDMSDRTTQQTLSDKARIDANEEKLAAADLEYKMKKKHRESILQSV